MLDVEKRWLFVGVVRSLPVDELANSAYPGWLHGGMRDEGHKDTRTLWDE